MTNPNEAGRAAQFWSAAIVVAALIYVVAGAVTGVIALGPGLLAAALVGGLALGVSRGFRWARTVLTVITAIQAINIFTSPDADGEGARVWLPAVLRASYIVAVAFCLWRLYRQPAAVLFSRPEAFVTRSAPLRRAGWRAVLLGSVASFIASFALAIWAIARLEQQYAVRADFGTNGLNWIAAGVDWSECCSRCICYWPCLCLFPISRGIRSGHNSRSVTSWLGFCCPRSCSQGSRRPLATWSIARPLCALGRPSWPRQELVTGTSSVSNQKRLSPSEVRDLIAQGGA